MSREQLTQEEVKEFWERCGFEWRESVEPKESFDSRGLTPIMSQEGWYYRDEYYGCHELPSIEPTNLFKYALPKITTGRRITVELSSSDIEGRVICRILKHYFSGRYETLAVGYAKDFAQALFLAVCQLIDS